MPGVAWSDRVTRPLALALFQSAALMVIVCPFMLDEHRLPPVNTVPTLEPSSKTL
jgi:hypothetical protein